MLVSGAAYFCNIGGGIPVLPPLALANGIERQDDESVSCQILIGELILRQHACQRIVATGRNNGWHRRGGGSRDVQVAGNPEIRSALEHDVLHAIAGPLRHLYDPRLQGVLRREATDHLHYFLPNEL